MGYSFPRDVCRFDPFDKSLPCNTCCVAVLEVINTPAIKKHNSDVWTLAEESHVVTRMLLKFNSVDMNTTITARESLFINIITIISFIFVFFKQFHQKSEML